MGTKDDPGDFDCYAKAADDEPIFTLRAKDQSAPLLVEMWAEIFALSPTFAPAKYAEALACATAMRQWRLSSLTKPPAVNGRCVTCGHASPIHSDNDGCRSRLLKGGTLYRCECRSFVS